MRSRLQSHEDKLFTRNIILSAVGFIIVFILLISFGLKLLIKISLFVSNIGNKESQTAAQPKEDDFNGSFELIDPPTATKSAKIIISGMVNGYDSVELFINNKKVKTLTKPPESFAEEIGDLEKKENSIYALAKTKDNKHEKKSVLYTVTYTDTKPKLEINEPSSESSKTFATEVKIVGSTNPGVTIKINGFPVVVNAEGTFTQSTRLKEGENKIEIHAEDVAGNTESKTLTVIQQKDE